MKTRASGSLLYFHGNNHNSCILTTESSKVSFVKGQALSEREAKTKNIITSLPRSLAACLVILLLVPAVILAQKLPLPVSTPTPIVLPTPILLPTPTPTPNVLPTPIPGVTQTVNLSGVVTNLTAATATTPGSITVGGLTVAIAPGTSLNTLSSNLIGANLELLANLNPNGQIISLTPLGAGVTANVNLCGVVSSITTATATAAGLITINGVGIPIAPGTSLTGSDQTLLGMNLCLQGNLNASGQLLSSSLVTANGNLTTNVCGIISALTQATATTPGSITVGGVTLGIAPGTALGGATVGSDLCLNGSLNAAGQINKLNSITADVNAAANLCGVISALTQATANLPGSITVGGVTVGIAPGTVLGNLNVGSNLCLNSNLNGAGQINGLTSITANVGGSVNLCGIISAFTAATANLPGSITIGGITLVIAPGTTLANQALLTLGTETCLTPTLNSSGQLIAGTGTIGSGCADLQFAVPLATYGFTKTAVLKDGDLFLLPQSLTLTLVSVPPGGATIFPVDESTFGGEAIDFGGFPDTKLKGLALSTPQVGVTAVSCSDSFRALNFMLASKGMAVGDRIRLGLQGPGGVKSQDLAIFTVQANGIVVTALNSNAVLYRGNRLGTGSGRLTLGALIALDIPAGSSGMRTDLLTLLFSKAPSSPLNGCFQLVVNIARGQGDGSTAIVFTDAVVNRIALSTDAANPGFGLIAGLTGGFPTGLVCQAACPTCLLACGPITLSSTSQSFDATGGGGSVNVSATGCSWTASSNVSWISITAGSSGNGNGTVSYSVAANTTGSPRTGTLTIANQIVVITQQ